MCICTRAVVTWLLTFLKYEVTAAAALRLACRFVLNTLQRFDQRSMGVMSMAEFLKQARAGVDDFKAAAGETVAIKPPPRSGWGRGEDGGGIQERGGAHEVGVQLRGDGRLSATDSDDIVIRWGNLKGVRGRLDVQALYFPIGMDEHRCRSWWNSHKHHLRVGDAVVRTVAHQLKSVGALKPSAPPRLLAAVCRVSHPSCGSPLSLFQAFEPALAVSTLSTSALAEHCGETSASRHRSRQSATAGLLVCRCHCLHVFACSPVQPQWSLVCQDCCHCFVRTVCSGLEPTNNRLVPRNVQPRSLRTARSAPREDSVHGNDTVPACTYGTRAVHQSQQ
jgi:hypothetical protein